MFFPLTHLGVVVIHLGLFDVLNVIKLMFLVGKSARNSMEFHDYSDSGPFELGIFIVFFLIVKCYPVNLEHVPSGSKSSPAIDSSDFMNQKTFPPSVFFWLTK
jgi:hypothetical protein